MDFTWGAPATTLHRHQHRLEGPAAAVRRLTSADQAMNGCEIRIVDGAGADCEPEVAGEILARSDALMLGYWNNPEATVEAFTDGWLRTGDTGVFDDEAFAFIVRWPEAQLTADAVGAHCRKLIAAYKRPKDVRFVDDLPKLPNGKVEKTKLRQLL